VAGGRSNFPVPIPAEVLAVVKFFVRKFSSKNVKFGAENGHFWEKVGLS